MEEYLVTIVVLQRAPSAAFMLRSLSLLVSLAAYATSAMVSLLLAGCASVGSDTSPPFLGFRMAGVTIARVTHLNSSEEQELLSQSKGQDELEARIGRGDFSFKAYLDDFRNRVAYLPGLTENQGRALRETGAVMVEVLVLPEIFPTQTYGESRLAVEEARYLAMARYNQALFHRFEQMGFPVCDRGKVSSDADPKYRVRRASPDFESL